MELGYSTSNYNKYRCFINCINYIHTIKSIVTKLSFDISIITKIQCKFATNCPNLMFLVSLERTESDLSNDALIVNFQEIHAKLQSN